MIEPPASRSRMSRAAARVPNATPFALTPKMRSNPDSVISSIGPPTKRPALFTITSTPPSARAASTTDSIPSGSETSVSTYSLWPPSSRMRSSVGVSAPTSRGSRSMSATITVAPAAAKRSAIARPIPELPPVTITTVPSKS